MNQQAIDSIKAERDAAVRERDAMAQEVERLTEGWRVSNNYVLHKALEIERLKVSVSKWSALATGTQDLCDKITKERDNLRAALKETK